MIQSKNIYKQPTILILDSGMGGLSIYTTIKKLLPHVNYLYFFDNQAFPYGERSEKFIIKRVISIIKTIKCIHHINLIIIACNTASVISLKILRNYFFPCPIVGVIPAIKLASKYTKNGIIGVLATHRTINHHYVLKLKKRFAHKNKIMLLGTSTLVNVAESKIYEGKVQISTFYQILKPWLKAKKLPDTVILGCTHFSLLKTELTQILPKNTYLIDPAYFVAKHSIYLLKKYTKIPTFNTFTLNQNKAYCSLNTNKIKKITSILLLDYNFFSLETLSII